MVCIPIGEVPGVQASPIVVACVDKPATCVDGGVRPEIIGVFDEDFLAPLLELFRRLEFRRLNIDEVGFEHFDVLQEGVDDRNLMTRLRVERQAAFPFESEALLKLDNFRHNATEQSEW